MTTDFSNQLIQREHLSAHTLIWRAVSFDLCVHMILPFWYIYYVWYTHLHTLDSRTLSFDQPNLYGIHVAVLVCVLLILIYLIHICSFHCMRLALSTYESSKRSLFQLLNFFLACNVIRIPCGLSLLIILNPNQVHTAQSRSLLLTHIFIYINHSISSRESVGHSKISLFSTFSRKDTI